MASSTFIPLAIHPDDPKVLRLASLSRLTPDEAVGRAVRWFRWIDQHCTTARTLITAKDVNRIVQLDSDGSGNFAEAMADPDVAWITVDKKGLVNICDYDAWLSNSAKRRRLDARRKAKSRNCGQMSANERTKNGTRGEERRGEEEEKARAGAESRDRVLGPARNSSRSIPRATKEDSDSDFSGGNSDSGSGIGVHEIDIGLVAIRRSLGINTPQAIQASVVDAHIRKQRMADWTDWQTNIEPTIRAALASHELAWFAAHATQCKSARKPPAVFRKRLTDAGIAVRSLRSLSQRATA